MTSKPGEDNELAAVFKKMMKPRDITPAMIIANFLIMWFPILAKAPTATAKAINHSMSVMNNQGREMLDIRMKQAEDGELEEKTDLLSLIVKENLRVPDPKDKLPDDEVMGQVRGHLHRICRSTDNIAGPSYRYRECLMISPAATLLMPALRTFILAGQSLA